MKSTTKKPAKAEASTAKNAASTDRSGSEALNTSSVPTNKSHGMDNAGSKKFAKANKGGRKTLAASNSNDLIVKAKSGALKGSIQKANLVANLVRKVSIAEAKKQLAFSNKSLAKDLLKTLNSALANAENNLGLDVDSMTISEILTSKAHVLRRHEPRGRGRAGIRRKRHFTYTVLLAS